MENKIWRTEGDLVVFRTGKQIAKEVQGTMRLVYEEVTQSIDNPVVVNLIKGFFITIEHKVDPILNAKNEEIGVNDRYEVRVEKGDDLVTRSWHKSLSEAVEKAQALQNNQYNIAQNYGS